MNNQLKNYTNQLSENLKKDNSGFKDNIWVADLANVQLISKLEFFYVINIFSKYAWVVCLKDKKGVDIVDAFQKILDKSGRKPNKIQ